LKGTHQNTSYQETSAANTRNWSNLPTWKHIRHQQPLLKFLSTKCVFGEHQNYGKKIMVDQKLHIETMV
jgi:hypothetical protein